MLTAISVARDCEMVGPTHKVILVNAQPSIGNLPPKMEFVYAEDTEKFVEEVHPGRDSMTLTIDDDNERFHFAITGKSWNVMKTYFPEMIPKLVVRGTIFARMSPDQKAQMIEQLQELGYVQLTLLMLRLLSSNLQKYTMSIVMSIKR